MADVVKSKVAAGEYTQEGEMIRDGLRVLIARDRVVENRLKTQVGTANNALKSDSLRAINMDQVCAWLAGEHNAVTTKTRLLTPSFSHWKQKNNWSSSIAIAIAAAASPEIAERDDSRPGLPITKYRAIIANAMDVELVSNIGIFMVVRIIRLRCNWIGKASRKIRSCEA